jgi:cytochrome c
MKRLPQLALALAISGLLGIGPASASQQIATKAGCMTCHSPDKKMIGPSFRDIAAKYKGQADAAAVLSERVRKGSKGVWGQVPMPASDAAKINDADLKAVTAWLLKPT